VVAVQAIRRKEFRQFGIPVKGGDIGAYTKRIYWKKTEAEERISSEPRKEMRISEEEQVKRVLI
jgi:hypothetical protein